ncbi:hypothetical protein ACA910_001317 [Epithemia clementina (nom. ined.)]
MTSEALDATTVTVTVPNSKQAVPSTTVPVSSKVDDNDNDQIKNKNKNNAETTTSKSPSPVAAATESAASAPPSGTVSLLDFSYEASKASAVYTQAKEWLQEGNYEAALTQIAEQGIQVLLEQLQLQRQLSLEEATMHISLAPFHYLYGTTLLYSIEEATEEQNPQQQQEGVEEPGAENDENQEQNRPENEHNENDDDDDPAEFNANDMVFVMPTQQPSGQQSAEHHPAQPPQLDEEQYEDLQIAFENLDTSRLLLEQYIQEKELEGSTQRDDILPQLQLDLAQILLREGDLQRFNGQYKAAIDDYTRCLHLRRRQQQQHQNNGTPLRSIADVHYNLALTYSLLVVESSSSSLSLPQEPEEEEQPHETDAAVDPKPSPVAAAAAASAAVAPSETALDQHSDHRDCQTKEEEDEWRQSSLRHYAACAELLTQQMLVLQQQQQQHQQDDVLKTEQFQQQLLPPHLLHYSQQFSEAAVDADDTKQPASTAEATTTTTTTTTQQLWHQVQAHVQALRDHVPITGHHGDNHHDKDKDQDDIIFNLQQLVEDILETIQEAWNAEEGLQQVQAMKSEITAAAAATVQAAREEEGDDCHPFPSSTTGAVSAFGSAAATALSATAQTTMTVRRKNNKRKDPPLTTTTTMELEAAAKKPALDDDDNNHNKKSMARSE